MRVIVKWMAALGHTRFSTLTRAEILNFFEQQRHKPGRNSVSRSSDGTISKYAALFVCLYEQRTKLLDALNVYPFDAVSASSFSGSWKAERPTPTIPDEVMVPLLEVAVSWLRRSEVLLERYNEVQAAYSGVWDANRGRRLSEVTMYIKGRKALKLIPRARNVPADFGPMVTLRESRAAQARLVDACYIIIAAFSGIRASELLSLSDACVRHIKHHDGIEYTYLEALLSKWSGENAGTAARWIVPAIVVEAIECLGKATSAARNRSHETLLFVTICGNGDVKPLSRQTMKFRIRRFASEIALREKSVKVRKWPLASHQFRKKFAQFAARYHSRSLHALSAHFKHTKLIITDRSYVGTDFELSQLIDDEIHAEIIADVQAIISGRTIPANKPNTLVAFQGRIDKRAEDNFIARKIKEARTSLQWFDGLLCLTDEDESALCGGKVQLQGLDVCLRCPNGVILKKHRSFWSEQKRMNEKLIKQKPTPQLRKVAKARINEAVAIIAGIDARPDGEELT